MEIVDWLDVQGTPEAHSARDEIERIRAEVAALKEDRDSLRVRLEEKRADCARAIKELDALKAPVGMEPVAWHHKITEPDGRSLYLLSQSRNNPWSHWAEAHKNRCAHIATPLYSAAQLAQVQRERDEIKQAFDTYREFMSSAALDAKRYRMSLSGECDLELCEFGEDGAFYGISTMSGAKEYADKKLDAAMKEKE